MKSEERAREIELKIKKEFIRFVYDYLVAPDFDFDINTGFYFKVSNFSDGVGWTFDFEDSGVNSHFEGVVSVCSFSARGFSDG